MKRSEYDNLGFLIADVTRSMRRAFQQRIDGSSLTLAQARALVYVSRNEGIRQVDLAELLEVQPMTLARLLDQLATAKLIERRPNPLDRRAYQIHLTPAAKPHLKAIEQVVVAIRNDAARGLGPGELEVVLRALRRMRDNMAPR
jgi:DNA-binding MarR family transcriptional regulator